MRKPPPLLSRRYIKGGAFLYGGLSYIKLHKTPTKKNRLRRAPKQGLIWGLLNYNTPDRRSTFYNTGYQDGMKGQLKDIQYYF